MGFGPVPRQKFFDSIDRMISNLGEDGVQVGLWVDAVQLGCFNERVNGGGAFAAVVRSSEQPVLAAECHHPFILPMSATNAKSIVAGIRILA